MNTLLSQNPQHTTSMLRVLFNQIVQIWLQAARQNVKLFLREPLVSFNSFSMKKEQRLSLTQIKKAQRKFVKDRDWDKFHTPKNLVMALAGESGELLEIFQWLTEKESYLVMKTAKSREAVKHEISDILYYLLRLSDILDIDIEAAFWEKLEHSRKKYPVHLAKGNAKKYSELSLIHV